MTITTDLHTAVRGADLAATADLLHAGTDPNTRGPDGLTPLMVASGLGLIHVVEMLLTAGADPLTAEPRTGATALHKAAMSGNTQVIEVLLDHGAFVDQQAPLIGNTPLMDAVLHRHSAAVQVLLARGARTTIRSHWQQTALDLARQDGLDTIAELIETRDAIDAERVGALTLVAAVRTGDIEEVPRLAAAGVNVNERLPITGDRDDDYTAMGVATRLGDVDMVRALLAAGADPGRVIGLMRGTAFHEAAYFGFPEILRVITSATDAAGVMTPALDAQSPYNGYTALHDAVWFGHREAVRVLLDAGARIDITTHAGRTPHQLAVLYGFDDIAELLNAASNTSSTSSST